MIPLSQGCLEKRKGKKYSLGLAVAAVLRSIRAEEVEVLAGGWGGGWKRRAVCRFRVIKCLRSDC